MDDQAKDAGEGCNDQKKNEQREHPLCAGYLGFGLFRELIQDVVVKWFDH
jgi:hypothetical protein